MLSKEEKHRYNRHIILDKVGIEGQEKLKNAKVLVIGAGGLGCPVLQYLTAAGVGTIGIVDFDTVDETNLQRQILFTIDDVGKPKAQIAAHNLEQLNPYVHFDVYYERLTNQNALDIFKQYDIIVDGSDNFSTRYLVNDACVITGKPLVYGSIFKFEGQVAVFNYKNSATYRCLFPEPPKSGTVPSCSEIGVIGVLPGIIGSLQANEVLKIILEIGEPLTNKVMIFNALNNSFFTLNFSKNEAVVKQTKAMENTFASFDYDVFCGLKNNDVNNVNEEILTDLPKDYFIIDVREEHERPKLNFNGQLLNIPLSNLTSQIKTLDPSKNYIITCQSGVRSLKAIELLKSHDFNNLYNLQKGVSGIKNKKLLKDE